MNRRFLITTTAACLIFVLLFGQVVFPAAEEETGLNTAALEAIEMLNAFHIATEDEVLDVEVTRGSVMAFLLKLLNATLDEANEQQSYFIDVGTDCPYFEEINNAYRYGIIKGYTDGKFRPYDPITPMEFATCILRIAGYDAQYAATVKDYPSIAYTNQMFSGISQNVNQPMTRSTMAILLRRALDLPVLKVLGLVAGGSESAHQYDINPDETVLTSNFKIKKLKATIVATEYGAIGGRSAVLPETVTVQLANGDRSYRLIDASVASYLGYDADIYVPSEATETPVLYYAVPRVGMMQDFELETKDVVSVSDKLTHFDYQPEHYRTPRRMELNSKTIFIYNGRMTYSVTAADFTPASGYLRVIDRDGDGIAEIVYLYDYETVLLSDFSATTKMITDRISKQQYKFDDDDLIRLYEDGREVAFSQLRNGCIISLAISRATTDRKLVTMHVSNNVIEGVLTGYDETEQVLQVDAQSYPAAHGVQFQTLQLGRRYTFGISHRGYIVCDAPAAQDGVQYGFVLNAGITYGLEEKISLKVYLSDSTCAVLDLADNCLHNRKKHTVASIQKAFYAPDGTLLQQLISFELNANGAISKLYTANEEVGFPTEKDVETLTLNSSYKVSSPQKIYFESIGGVYIMTPSTLVFVVGLDKNKMADENSIKLVSNRSFTWTSSRDMKIYDASYMRIPSVVVVFEDENTDRSVPRLRDRPMLLESVKYVIDEKDEEIITVEGYVGGKKTSYKIADGVDPYALVPGNCITTTRNAKGEVMEYFLKFAPHKPAKYNDTTGLFGDATYTLAQPAYKSVSDFTATSISLYGSLIAVQNGEARSMLMQCGGVTEALAYLVSDNAQIHQFDYDNNRVTACDITDIPKGAPIFVFAKSGVVTDIVYFKNMK